jgi:hypothetical protein
MFSTRPAKKNLLKTIDSSLEAFKDQFKKRWYDNGLKSGYSKSAFYGDKVEGEGFAKKTGELFNSIQLQIEPNFEELGSRNKYKYKLNAKLVSTRPDLLPVRNEPIALYNDAGFFTFEDERTGKPVYTKHMVLAARTKGMDRWLSRNFNTSMQNTLTSRQQGLGTLFQRSMTQNTLADR